MSYPDIFLCILVKLAKKEKDLNYFIKTLDIKSIFVYNSRPF